MDISVCGCDWVLTQGLLLCPLHFSSVVEINFTNERKLLLMSLHLQDNKTSWPLFTAFEKADGLR